MFYKSFINNNALDWTKRFGLKFTTFGETFNNFAIGVKVGAMCLVTVIFGLYSVKNVNIPMFGTMRRCCILTTVIVNYIIRGDVPDKTLTIVVTMLVAGAIIAGYENLDSDMFGYGLVWGNNLF